MQCNVIARRGWRALPAWEEQRQVVFDLVADRLHGVAFSLIDPELQAVLGHKVGIVLAELIDLRRHVPQGGIL